MTCLLPYSLTYYLFYIYSFILLVVLFRGKTLFGSSIFAPWLYSSSIAFVPKNRSNAILLAKYTE